MSREPIRISILNPNATQSMTDEMVASAQLSVGGLAKVEGLTNSLGPAAIQGPKDAEDCLSGLFGLFETARSQGADGIIVGCFDDTGLRELRARGTVPVIGLGEAGCIAGSLAASRFSVVTTLVVSVPVIAENIRNMGLWDRCNGVHPSGVAVLELSSAGHSLPRITNTIDQLLEADPHQSIVLGCGGMTAIASEISPSSPAHIIDPVVAAVQLCLGVVSASSRSIEQTKQSVKL
ncbi:aspartate/glutamate racemase family protein [Marivita hallyeonensis]|uniref:Allantoin racemase n=1 Tax=Marivita hallyeonensis TaxID=996342 RepID=A0A1M5NWQ6_9RHOB|nr:allantoin racemase [Marivita hallyeonensis]